MRLTILFLFAIVQSLLADRVPGRFIVELSTEPVTEHVARLARASGRPVRERLSSASASAHRTRVRAEQQAARARLERGTAKVLGSVDTVANALLIEAPEVDAAGLASVAGVKRVMPVRRFHMILDRAVEIHKVAEAWNRIGNDRAGAGIRIGIIDSGINANHPGFQDASLTVPASFPRVNRDSDLAYTNNKIIVARSYVDLLPGFDRDSSAQDRVGHGTALAMAAAGIRNAGPLATIAGMAPKAYLGSYKIFGSPGSDETTTEDVILKAIDDAVADGMDIINLSFGTDYAPRLSDDPSVQAVERATQAGVIVVVAAGNNGPDYTTIASPATAPSAIAVGATTSDRTFSASVEVSGLSSFVAVAGSGSAQSTPVTGLLADVATIDGEGLACSALPAASLSNRVALILRGTCTFETKLMNAQNAGALAGLIYAREESPSPVGMQVGIATLPAEMISHQDGTTIKNTLASQAELIATLKFTLNAVPTIGNRLAGFSAAGPNVDISIKPDVMAVGNFVYTATQSVDPRSSMYSSDGYILVNGTSFSAPIVAGAAALLKSARPGLTVDQYRSLLLNTTTALEYASIQQAGAGLLNLDAAVTSTVTAYPASLSLGAGNGDPQIARTIRITNFGPAHEAFQVDTPAFTGGVTTSTYEIAAGASLDVPVSWTGAGLTPGAYQGFVTVSGTTSGSRIRIPFWYAVASGSAGHIAMVDLESGGRPGERYSDAIMFRLLEASGITIPGAQPEISVVSGGGEVLEISSYDGQIPGLIGVTVRLGPTPGDNVFRIQSGGVIRDVTIPGQ
jgi:subtilisin family serine protease